MQVAKPRKRKLNGVLLLDKAIGISSNTALQQARHLYQAEKAGHTGILDPLASGLLPICFGEATKFAQYLLDADKAYIATMQLGVATTTGDAEGEIIETSNKKIEYADFQAACQKLTGAIEQVPPMFSALKHEGKPLYEYARRGIQIERKARHIHIHQIEITHFQFPYAQINVLCSKGAYIRTLSEDIAKTLGTFAHLTALRRTETAGFHITQTYNFETLSKLPENERDTLLLPCDVLVQHFPQIRLSDKQIQHLQYGQKVTLTAEQMIQLEKLPENQAIRVYNTQQNFIGLAKINAYQQLQVVRLMNTSNG